MGIVITGIYILKNHELGAVNDLLAGRYTNRSINNLTEHVYINIDKLRETFPVTALITIAYTDNTGFLKALLPYQFGTVDNSLSGQHHMLNNGKRTSSRWEIFITILPYLFCPATLVETNTVLTGETGQPCTQTHTLHIEETSLCRIFLTHNKVFRTQLGNLRKIRIAFYKRNRIDISRPCITTETNYQISSILMSKFQKLSPVSHSL